MSTWVLRATASATRPTSAGSSRSAVDVSATVWALTSVRITSVAVSSGWKARPMSESQVSWALDRPCSAAAPTRRAG